MKKISVYSDGRTMMTKVLDENNQEVQGVQRLLIDFDAQKGMVGGTLWLWKRPENGTPHTVSEDVQILRLFMEPGNYAVPCQV